MPVSENIPLLAACSPPFVDLALDGLGNVGSQQPADFLVDGLDHLDAGPIDNRLQLGTELLARLLNIGRDEKLERVVAEILPENEGMRRVCTKLGFKFSKVPDSNTIYAEIAL